MSNIDNAQGVNTEDTFAALTDLATLGSVHGKTAQAVSSMVRKKKINTIVIFGASIMYRSFNVVADTQRTMASLGIPGSVEVVNAGVSGEVGADAITRLQTLLTTYAGRDDVLFFVHHMGNDVSGARPYATATDGQITNFGYRYREIIESILGEGHECMASRISYRDYSDVPPEENGSEPFNTNIVEPIIKELLPNSWNPETNATYIDMYQFSYDNRAAYFEDEVHPVPAFYGPIRELILSGIAEQYDINASGVDPDSIPVGTRFIASFASDVDAAQSNYGVQPMTRFVSSAIKSTNSTYKITAYGDAGSVNDTGGKATGDSSSTLLNSDLILSQWFTSNVAMDVEFGGLPKNRAVTLRVTASRDRTDGTRVGDYTVDGVTQQMNAESETPEIIEFTTTTSENGTLVLTYALAAGNSFAHVNGAEIIV